MAGVRKLLFALFALLVCAAPAYAAFPGANGQIAYQRDLGESGENTDVWLINPDGSDPRELTTSPLGDGGPSFSADGARIAFTHSSARSSQIFTIGSDGSGLTRVTGFARPAADAQPRFTPDGSRIVLSRSPDGFTNDILSVALDGSGAIALTSDPNNDFAPDVTADGRIAWVSLQGGNQDIWVMNADGSGQTDVSNNPEFDYGPSFSPDGQRIAFTSERDGNPEIYVMNADGSGQTRLTTNPDADTAPAFSPDGSLIAFTRTTNGNSGLYVMDSAGSVPTRLVDSAANETGASWGTLAPTVPPPPPVLGESADARAVSGTVLVKRRGRKGFTRLVGSAAIPVGSELDTRHGTVRLTSAANAAGKTQTGRFSGGLFKIGQRRGGQPFTDLTLTGRLKCRKGGKGGPLSGSRARSRRLFGRGHGRFRTRGLYSTSTIRGTVWLTKDSCNGTLTLVQRGTVLVRDLVKHRTVKVKAGQRYLARPR